jgi:hypothetical protein
MSIIYPGEIESILGDLKHDASLTHRQRWALCDILWSDPEEWRWNRERDETFRRLHALEQALGCVESGRQLALDVIDTTIQIDLLWNSCQGPYAKITVPGSDGPVIKRRELQESATGPTLAVALVVALTKVRLNLWRDEQEAKKKREQDAQEDRPERAPVGDVKVVLLSGGAP